MTIAFCLEVGQSMEYIQDRLEFEACERQGAGKGAELVCGRPREDVFAGRAVRASDCGVGRGSSSLLDCCRPLNEPAAGRLGGRWSKPETLF